MTYVVRLERELQTAYFKESLHGGVIFTADFSRAKPFDSPRHAEIFVQEFLDDWSEWTVAIVDRRTNETVKIL